MSRGLAGPLPGTGSSIITLEVCTVDNASRTIQINAEKEVVKNSPSLAASDEMSPEYEPQVRSYYGKEESVWEACGVGTSDVGVGPPRKELTVAYGEQTTGTRDEHYNLISVLYHALHGAENCDRYAADAGIAGDERLAAFFRETQAMQTQVVERAKGLLGILEPPPEFGVGPGTISGGVPRGTSNSEEAVKHARAVATVLQTTAVSGGELEDVRSQLGNDHEKLFGHTGSSA